MSIQSKLIKGDISALEEVYRLHYKKVYHVIRKYINDDSLIDDITQEVFLRLWRNKDSISTQIPIEQQLFTLTKNLVFNHFRKKTNELKFLTQYKVNNNHNITNDEDDKNKQLKKINDLVDKLPKKQQEVFKMYRFQGLTYEEIAQILNVSKNTVSSHLSTAMSFIKKNANSLFF
ncbi:MAG: sigma-70 family RNA polymerase sigma factor [Flavobacteriaceae bacterium]|nr:sigma-70 family RNA polymerase sigma factor [Flavobacteriaceae bacterium]